MSGGLESLRNPLERLSVLPQSLNWRVDPTTNDPTWDVGLQYYKYDVVISGVDGGAYVFTGGLYDAGPPEVFPITCLLGGVDPALDTNGYWQKLTQTGVQTLVTSTPTFALAGAAGAQTVTVTGGGLTGVDAGSVWSGTLTFSAVWSAPQIAGDVITFTAASNGTAGTTDIEDVAPILGSANTRSSVTFLVSAGSSPPAPINISLTAAVASAAPIALNTLTGSIAWVRLK